LINRNDTSVSKSDQLDFAIPASKIAALSSGEFITRHSPSKKSTIQEA